MAAETEKYSGLRLADRKIAVKRWDELMAGKKFTSFSSLTVASESASIVAIGVLYERGLAKTSANGGRFSHWSLTDLCFPQPRLLKLLLMGEAFETWDLDLGKSVRYGAVFAILNPAPLPSSKSGTGNETLVSAKITHSTQLVLLGTCPSLGFCRCRKKDGLQCSMPCDIDRGGGALVCFYHTMQQEADKVRKWSTRNTTASRGKDATTAGLIVKEGPALRAPPRPRPGDRVAKDPALERLLSSRLPATPARKTSAAAGAAPTPPGTQPMPAKRQQSPTMASGTQAAAPKGDSWTSAPSQRTAPRALEQADGAAPDAAIAARQILALFPDGIPAPDPNRPMESRMQFERASFEALRRREVGGAGVPSAPPTPSPPQNLAQSKGVSKDNREYSGKTCAISAPAAQATAPPPPAVSIRQLESDFGRKVARQLAFKADPRLDVVRQQSSRFQSAMEEERAAKRMRRLHELEAMDAAQEVMEEIKSMKVRAWRCANCFSTFESFDQLKSCQEKGHKVTEKEATKTRWECGSCRHSEAVLDRQLPSYCRSCNGCNWKQVSLRKVPRAAPMEKDLLLPRGEELPFLNSIHIPDVISKAPPKQAREAHDDYEGL